MKLESLFLLAFYLIPLIATGIISQRRSVDDRLWLDSVSRRKTNPRRDDD